MKRIAFYTRISTDENMQRYSLDAQRDRLESFCKGVYGEQGFEIIDTYRDMESGAHVDRPQLKRMLADAAAGRFEVLVVFRVDRLSRKLADLVPMVEGLTKAGVCFRSVSESFDTASASGRAMMQLLGVFGELERENIIERTKVGMEKKARTGAWVSGAVPYAYVATPDKKAIVVVPDEAFIVRRVYEEYATGNLGVRAIRDRLTADGHRKRSGKPWDPRTLLLILTNPVYVGKIRWNSAVYPGTQEAIVSQKVFDRAGEILKARAAELKGRQWHTDSERLATGIIHCALCGRAMVGVSGNKNGRKIPYYVCNGRLSKTGCTMAYIRADLLEEQIIEGFQDLFRSEKVVERIWKAASRMLDEERPELEAEATKIDGDIATAEEQIERYYRAFEASTMNPETCGPRVAEIEAHAATLRARRAALAERTEHLAMPTLDLKEVAGLMDDFERVFESGLNPERKHLLHRLVKEVRVQDRDTAEVWYSFPRPAAPDQRTVDSHIWLLR